jgi:murein DD-endopeptidase MepM/ murein hydrolase activator NlpD
LKINKNFSIKVKHQLREKYKLVIMNSNTFEEKLSIELTPLFVFVFITISSLFLIVLTTLIITITPLREWIPGYGSAKHGQKIVQLQKQIDSLNRNIESYELYRQEIQQIFLNEKIGEDTTVFQTIEPVKNKEKNFAFSADDSLLMQINIQGNNTKALDEKVVFKKNQRSYTLLFTPLKGQVVSVFNPLENRYGIKVISYHHSVYATASGNVVYVAKGPDSKHIIVIQHPDNTLSLYRFKGEVYVKHGDIVNTGQLIGKGLDEEMELYFELWMQGKAVNPEHHITF